MKVKHAMSTPVVTVTPFTAIRDVARHMDHSGVGCVIVSDGNDVTGIVTDRDLVLRAMAKGTAADAVVGEVMTQAPVVVQPEDDLDVAVEMFRRYAFRRLPVVDAGTAVGIVTVDDLLLRVHQVTTDLLRPVAKEISEPQHPPDR